MDRRRLAGSIAGLLASGSLSQAAAQTSPPATPVAGSTQAPGVQLLIRFVDEVLNGRSVETLASIAHPEIEYPNGRMIGIDGFRSVWINDHEQREQSDVDDEYAMQVVLGDDQWGIMYLIYKWYTKGRIVIWKMAYIAQITDGLIRELDVVIDGPHDV